MSMQKLPVSKVFTIIFHKILMTITDVQVDTLQDYSLVIFCLFAFDFQ